ncbi:MAG: hypothetical protein EHM44_03265 [Ignavibacteriales bacterium]|nr:MAG: hypothetical protein EHM44_03265 [Ignavibacteriales bacterium]
MKHLLIVVFSVYVLILAFFSLDEFPNENINTNYFPYLAERPITEDGFYALKVAWNIGNGDGVVYNFNQPTTGIQPLFVFLTSGLAFINKIFNGDKNTFLRLVILFSGLIQILFVFILFKLSLLLAPLASKNKLFFISILVVLYNFKLFLNFFNGLETGLYLVLLGLCIYKTFKLLESKPSLSNNILFGFLLGITALARLDFIIIAVTLILLLMYNKKISFSDLIVISISLTFVLTPWFYYVFSIQNSFIPTSAVIQSGISTSEFSYRIDQFIFSLLSNFVPFYHAGLTKTILFYPIAIVVITIIIKYKRQLLLKYWNNEVLKYWIISISLILVIYLIFASQPYFYFLYISIPSVITLPFFIVLIFEYFEKKSKLINFTLQTIIIIFFFINIFYYFHIPKNVAGLAVRPIYIQNHLHMYKKIGMAQCGISGFFFDNIINLDGKVNLQALKAIKSNNLYQYINDEKIDVLIEWKEWFEILDEEALSKNFVRYFPDLADRKTIVYTKDK